MVDIDLCKCGETPQFKDVTDESGESMTYMICPVCGREGNAASSESGAVFNWNHNLLQNKGKNVFVLLRALEERVAALEKKGGV